MAGTAFAQSCLTIYGRVDLAIAYYRGDGVGSRTQLVPAATRTADRAYGAARTWEAACTRGSTWRWGSPPTAGPAGDQYEQPGQWRGANRPPTEGRPDLQSPVLRRARRAVGRAAPGPRLRAVVLAALSLRPVPHRRRLRRHHHPGFDGDEPAGIQQHRLLHARLRRVQCKGFFAQAMYAFGENLAARPTAATAIGGLRVGYGGANWEVSRAQTRRRTRPSATSPRPPGAARTIPTWSASWCWPGRTRPGCRSRP